jgi:hypothetical protein
MLSLKELEELEALQRETKLTGQALKEAWQNRPKQSARPLFNKPPIPNDLEFYAREYCNRLQREVNESRVQMGREPLSPPFWTILSFKQWNPKPYNPTKP